MKKRGLYAILLGMAVMSFTLFNSCDIDIGLGAAVDTEAPSIVFDDEKDSTNPPIQAIIRDSFTISGKWSDDGSISSVSASLQNTVTKKSYSFGGNFEGNIWRASINPIEARLPDGKYEATITVSDNGGHSSKISRSYVIDNTPPVVVLSRPSSEADESDENKIESYGQYLTLEGQAADDNNIECIIVKFYSKEDPDTLIWQKKIESIPPTISLDIAHYLDNDVYSKIYGDEEDGDKFYFCTISAYDGAKRYSVKGEEKADDDLGNEESSYILWSKWEKFQQDYQKATGSTSKIKLPDLYALRIKNNTESRASTAVENTLITDLFSDTTARASFKLNPRNNPTFSISGLDLGFANDVENERSLTIQLAKGVDGILLDTDNMKVYLIPLNEDENGNEVRGKKIYPQQSTYQNKGDGQFLTAIQKDNAKDSDGNNVPLVYGTTYVIGVDGDDTEGNKIVPSFDGKEFFIRFKAKNVAPGLTIDEPSVTTSYLKKGDTLKIKGTTSVPDGYPTVSITCKKGDETTDRTIYTYKVKDTDIQKIQGDLVYYNWEFEVPASGTAGEFFFDQGDPDSDDDASDQYDFEITSDLDSMPTKRTKTVIYDLHGPTISIDSMLPTAEKYTGEEDGTKADGDYLNGDVEMKVAILDDYDSVNTTDNPPYFYITDESNNKIKFRVIRYNNDTKAYDIVEDSDIHYINKPSKQSFIIKTEDIANGTSSKNIKVKLVAQDRAGNLGVDIDDNTKTYYERSYTVDQTTDIPIILPENSDSLTLTYETKEELLEHLNNKEYKSILGTGNDLRLSIKDDDGIKKVSFFIGNKDTAIAENATPVLKQTLQTTPKDENFTYRLPTVSGRYECRIEIEDIVGKTASKNFWIIVTEAAPQLTISSTTPDNKIITLSNGEKTDNAKVQFENVIAIESGYTEFTVKRREKINDVETETILYGENGTKGTILKSNSFTDIFVPAANHNENKIKYVVTDEMGQSGEREFIYYTDSAAPIVDTTSIVVPNSTQTESVSFRFAANSNDPAEGNVNAGFKQSGISKLEYVFESGAASSVPSASALTHKKIVTGVSSLNETVIFGDEEFTEVFNTEGIKTIYIRAIDDVGNIGAWVAKEFMFDKAAPAVTISSYQRDGESVKDFAGNANQKSFETGKKFTLSGNVSDSNRLKTFEIWQKKEGENHTYQNADGIKLMSVTNKANGSWTIENLPRDENDITQNALDSGTYIYTVRASDNSAFGTVNAKTESDTLKVYIDKTKPEVSIDLAVDGTSNSTAYGENSLKGNAYTFRGSVSDDPENDGDFSSGFSTLYYVFTTTESPEPTLNASSLFVKPTTNNWSIPMNLGTASKTESGSDSSDTLTEGKKYLWVRGVDNAGNWSDVKHVAFMVDQKAPEVTFKVYKDDDASTPLTATNGTIKLKASDFIPGSTPRYTLRGTAWDANGINRLIIDNEEVTVAANGSWSKEITRQGTNVHTIVVEDKSGRNESGLSIIPNKQGTPDNSYTIIFDTVKPDNVSIIGYDEDPAITETDTLKRKWLAGTGENYINGTAYDSESGLAEIKIIVDKKDDATDVWTTLTLASEWTYKYQIPSNLQENDDSAASYHTVTVKAVDKAGNETVETRYFRYDKTLPFAELSLNKNEQYVKASDFENITFSGYAHDGQGAEGIENSGRAVGSAKIKVVKGTDEANASYLDVTTNSTPGTAFGNFTKSGLKATDFDDGTYTFTLEVKDKAGNSPSATSALTQRLIVDKTLPSDITAKFVVGNAERTSIKSKDSKATIQVTFTEANIDSVYYYVDDSSVAERTAANAPEDDWIGMNRDNSYTGEGYKYTKTHQFGDGKGKVYIKIVDKAGNVAYASPLDYEVDTKAPDVCTLGKVWVKNDDGTLTELAGTKLINGTKPIVFTVTATDYDDNYNTSTPRAKIGNSASKIESVRVKSIGSDSTIENVVVDGPTASGVWTLTIPTAQLPSSDASVTVTVKDTFGNEKDYPALFSLDIDSKPPRLENYSLATSYDAGLVGTAGSEVQTFYMNNEKNGFKLEGIAKDDRITPGDGNGEIEKVVLTLTESGTNGKTKTIEKSDSAWTFEIANSEWKTWTGDVTGTLSVTDKAKNVVTTTKTFKIIFDNEAPKAMHWADNSNKDIYFRIGNAANDKKESDATKWETGDAVGDGTTNEDKLNSDVGKKYSYGSWGNDSTIEIRGNFYEAATGSGLKTIYYAIFDADPITTKETINGAELTLKAALESGILKSKSQSSHINAIGSFAPLETAETRKVPYTAADGSRLSQEVVSNFRTSLPGFNGVENYLLLVAEDSVGNRAVDALENSNTAGNAAWNSSKAYYHINKDATAPTISGSITSGSYTNGSTGNNVVVKGSARDNTNGSGLASVTVRITDKDNQTVEIEDKTEKDARISGNTWEASIPAGTFSSGVYTVYAKATDRAGEGNSKEVSVGTITVDKDKPRFDTDSIKLTEKIGTADPKTAYSFSNIYYINNTIADKTFNITGRAEDDLGVKDVSIEVVNSSDTNQKLTINPLLTNGSFTFNVSGWSSWTSSTGATVSLKVTDKAGNEVETPYTMNIVFDTTAPTVVPEKNENEEKIQLIITPTETETQSDLFTFKGSAGSISDGTGSSGPKTIDIAFTTTDSSPSAAQVTGIEVSSTGVWSSTVEFGDSKFGNVFKKTENDKEVDVEGPKYLWIKTHDNAGNTSVSWTKAKSFVYDKAVPTISFKDTDSIKNPSVNSYNNDSFTLQVEASDGYGLKSVDILGSVSWTTVPANWSTIHTEYYKDESCKSKAPETFASGTYYFKQNITSLTTNVKTGTYSKTFGKNALTDGCYNFKVVVTDNAEKSNFVSRTFTLDTGKPIVDVENSTVTNPTKEFTTVNSTKWYSTSQISVSIPVTDKDSLSQISSVLIATDSAFGNYSSLSLKNGKWEGSITCNAQGKNTIYIKATDGAGNSNDISTTNSIDVYIDTTAPSAPIFLGAGPSNGVVPASQITSLLVNPNLNQDVIVYAAIKDEGNAANSTGIAASDAFKQKDKSGASDTAATSTITGFTPAWAASHEYVEGNVVKNNNTLYMCTTAHTSGTSFTAANWTSLYDYDIWSYTIPTTDMLSGGINFTVKDKAGNTADYTLFQMTVDQNPPQLTVDDISDADSSTADVTEINGKISISGIASDENGLSISEQMKLYYTKSTTLSAAPDLEASNIGDKTKASDANTKWIEISSIAHSASWKFNDIDTSKLDGTNAITDGTVVRFIIVAKDKAGNAKCSNIIAAKVDQNTDRPVITITDFNISNNSTMYLQGTKTLSGSVSDDDGTVTKFEYKKGSSGTWTAVNLTGTSWRISNLDEGENTLYFRVTDAKSTEFVSRESGASGTSPLPKITDTVGTTYLSDTDVKLTFNVVTIKPKVTNIKYQKFDSQNGTNGTWGSATNDPGKFGGNYTQFKIQLDAQSAQGISSVKVTYNNVEYTLVSTDTITDENKNQTHTYVMNGTSSIPVNLSTQDFDGQQTISIVAADTVPNSTPTEMEESIYVDNKTPVISVTNPSSSQYSSGNIIAYGETDLTYWKNIAATDQPKEFMYYALSLDDSTSPAVDFDSTSSASAATITSWKDENGTIITDTNKPVGATATLSYKPYYTPIKGGSFNWYVYFDGSASTESESHDVTFRQFLIDSGVTTQAAIEATDSNAKFKTKVQAYLWIKAEDQVGNFVETKHPILIDPQGDAPSVTIDYPETDGTTLGGSVTLRGTAKDEKGTNPGVDSVWVQIISAKENGYVSTNADQTFGNADTDSAASGLKFKDTYTAADGKHSYEVTGFKPTMKDVKQWINAKDSSNKAIYEVYTDITITPKKVSDSDIVTNEGANGYADWLDTADGSNYYIKAKFSGSAWSLDINKISEFNPAEGKLNPIAYRIFSKDKDNNLSSYEQQLSVFDSDNPILGALYLRQYSDNDAGTGNVLASRPYEDDMWINGTWWLYGTVTDTDGLSVLKVNNTDQDKDGGTINYKLSTTNEVDSFELEIVASDNANNGTTPHTTKKTCVINYDKKKPELATTSSSDFNISQAIQNSNGFYTFGSQVTENQEGGKAQSGFDYLAFWFERTITGTNAKHVVFDVMRPKSTETETYASEVDWSSLATFTKTDDAKGLKWKKISTTRSSTDLGKLTIDSEDKNIHVGGICMISGSIYFITSVEQNTTTWEIGINGQPEYTTKTQDVYFAIANVVNNTVESGKGAKLETDGAYGYYSTVDNDDGDHMLESVKKQGTAWTWEANINSQNMGDGDITLHYVAFDKAGNFKEGSVTGKVANNAPRLASVTVWSDFNANGDPDEGESETKYYQGKERKFSIGYEKRYVQRATALNPTDNVFVVSGNNKDYNDGGSGFMTVKDKTRFIPEIVGGNGDLYYSYRYGKASDFANSIPPEVHVGEKIGKGADHGVDEDADSEGYYKEDLNNSGYIEGRTDLWEGITGETKKYMEIPGELTTDDAYTLKKLGNHSTTDPMWFEYTIYDSTLGCADWNTTTLTTTGRLSSTFRVALAIKYTDETNPVVKIRPFYWNSKSDNSVSWDSNGNAEGHIELESDLTDAIKGSGTGQLGMGDDPKVSGKIVIDGFAYDDMKLKELHVQMLNHKKLDTQQTASTYNGTWTTRNFEDGWGFRAEDVYCNGNGHLVHWWLTVDTAARTNVAALDQSVVVYAVDARGGKESVHNSTTAQTSLTSYKWRDVKDEPNALKKYYTDFYYATKVTDKTETETLVYKGPESYTWKAVKTETNATSTYYTDFYCQTLATDATTDDTTVYKDTSLSYRYKMDIVPYITEVTTNLSNYNRNKPSVYARTAIGNYSVSSGEQITIRGFNLKNSQNTVVTINGVNNSFTSSSQSATAITGTVADAATSGKLELYAYDGTNKIYALNNKNGNDSKGSATALGSDNSNGYNRQPNGINNNLLTDDVELDVYEFTTVATPRNGVITDPFMRINPKTGQPGFSFNNAVLYFNMPGYDGDNGNTTYSHTTFGGDNGGYTNGTFAWDANGNSFGIATCTDTGWPAASISVTLFSKRTPSDAGYWHPQQAYTNAKYQRGIESNTISLTADQPKNAGQYTTDIGRIISPAIATKVSGTTTTLYIAYYDRLSKQVRFRTGTVANDANNITGALQDIFYRTDSSAVRRGAPDSIYVDGASKQADDRNTQTIDQTDATGTSNGRIEIVASKSLGTGYLAAYQNDTTYGPGEHVDIGLSGNNVVITWYDSVNRKLMISYENPTSLQHDKLTATGTLAYSGDWQSNAFAVEDTTGVGLYVKMAVDPAGGIHLAYYNNNGGDLKYAYISSSDLTRKQVTSTQIVDSYLSVGARPTIDVTRIADSSVTGDYRYVPYIGYQMNSNLNTTASARFAYPVRFNTNGIPLGSGSDDNDMFTGNWEIKTVPTQNTPIDGKISAGVWTKDGVQKEIPSGTNSFTEQTFTSGSGWNQTTFNKGASYAQTPCERAIVWGNGTMYPVISYAVSEEGKLEMAQMK